MYKKNISNLLSCYNFVVPEIQREYVWGGIKNKKVLEQFIRDLDQKLSKGEANIGFLYSYKSGSEHYLIDGQQRFTTILLLLFYLSVRDGEEKHKEFVKCLRLDEPLQAFSYRVRSYTESFLQNLLQHDPVGSKDVQDQVWFKNEYQHDPTIDAMLGALNVFEEIVPSVKNITYRNIMERVFFWYFDVERTSQGEELYITMNSRGEKLTDSEQIKPRLLRKETETKKKEYFGKKWDEWEEFFYDKKFRANRSISTIDIAMNNIIRVILELKTGGEHNTIKPVEDSGKITLDDIEKYMEALQQLSGLSDGKYISEVVRLYGDGTSDANFCVLKALLTETIKGQEDAYEYERMYQTILNQVRRNKLNNLSLLKFLDAYIKSPLSLYPFIEKNPKGVCDEVINGHELEKVKICASADNINLERAIWAEQSREIWNGEMKSLVEWSKVNEIFSFDEYERIRNNIHKLFDSKQEEGFTTDCVRQALIARNLPHYPLDHARFGYSREDWKEVFSRNSKEVLEFFKLFDNVAKGNVVSTLEQIKKTCDENNEWVEFVKYDYFLDYCNTKHLYWTDTYGWLLVKNSYAQPISVKNMRLYHDLKEIYETKLKYGWRIEMYISWESCVYIQNDENKVFFDIWYFLENGSHNLEVELSQRNVSDENFMKLETELRGFIPDGIEMTWDQNTGRYKWRPDGIDSLKDFVSRITGIA